MQSETRTIDPPADFELGVPRARPLTYTVSRPRVPAKGLVFLIPGFGADAAAGYAEALRRHICETHGFAAVSVDYHCVQARIGNGAGLKIPMREHFMLVGIAAHLGIRIDNTSDVREIADKLAAAGAPIQAYADILPGGGEYQNFGILQALDHIAVLADMVRRGPEFDPARIIALGSSHGGYIAQLIAKIAPNSLSLVIDNSSYTQPPMAYLGIGAEGEVSEPYGGVTLVGRVKSGWTVDRRDHPSFYSRDADLIRDVGHLPHLRRQRQATQGSGPVFAMVNAADDSVSPADMKRRQADAMSAAGFDAHLDIITAGDVEGALYKAYVHGLDASLKRLFDLKAPLARKRAGPLDCESGTVVEYPCVDLGYRFTHTAHGVLGATFELYPPGRSGKAKVAA